MILLGSLLLIVIKFNKHYIGIGTLINLVVLGFVVDASFDLFHNTLTNIPSIMLLLMGVVVVCFGAALYIMVIWYW